MTDALSAIVKALSPGQRDEITADFARVNPSWDGATCADVLDLLSQADACLDVTEPFAEAHPDLMRVPGWADAVTALHLLGGPVTRIRVVLLLRRAGLLNRVSPADVIALSNEVRDLSGQAAGLAAAARELGSEPLAAALGGYGGDLLVVARRLDEFAKGGL